MTMTQSPETEQKGTERKTGKIAKDFFIAAFVAIGILFVGAFIIFLLADDPSETGDVMLPDDNTVLNEEEAPGTVRS